jgi:TRAP-type mannitol/chloroaromatic compound transport system permease small subunit
MDRFLRVVDSISDWSGRITSYLVYVGIFVLSFEVFARYFFNAPTVWAHGYSQRIFGTYFVLIGAYTLLKGGHVRVDVVYVRLRARGKLILDMVNYMVLLIWSVVLVGEAWTFFARSFQMREVDEMVLAHPIYPVKFFMVIGTFLIALQGLAMFIKSLREYLIGAEHES